MMDAELDGIFAQLTAQHNNMAAAAAASAASSAAAASAAASSRPSPPYLWQVNLAVDSASDAIVWSAYTAAESDILEAARARKQTSVVLSETHKADLIKMRQVRRDDPKRWRRIRRIEGLEAAQIIAEAERAQQAALLIEDPLRAAVNRHRLHVQQLVERTLEGRDPAEISMAQFAEIKHAMEDFKTFEAQAKKAGLSQRTSEHSRSHRNTRWLVRDNSLSTCRYLFSSDERLPAVLTEVQEQFMGMLPTRAVLDEQEAADRALNAGAGPAAAAAASTSASSASASSSVDASASSVAVVDPLPDSQLPAALKIMFEDANTAFGLPFLAPPLRDLIVSYARSHAGPQYTVAQSAICEECRHEEGVPVFPTRWGGQIRRLDEFDMRAYCYAQIFEAAQCTMLVVKYSATWRKYGAACIAKKYAHTPLPDLIRIVQAVEPAAGGDYWDCSWPIPSIAIRDAEAKDDGEVDENGDWHDYEPSFRDDAPPQVRLQNTTLWMRDGVDLGIQPRSSKQLLMVTQLRGMAAAPELQLPPSLYNRLEDAVSRHIGPAQPAGIGNLFPAGAHAGAGAGAGDGMEDGEDDDDGEGSSKRKKTQQGGKNARARCEEEEE